MLLGKAAQLYSSLARELSETVQDESGDKYTVLGVETHGGEGRVYPDRPL